MCEFNESNVSCKENNKSTISRSTARGETRGRVMFVCVGERGNKLIKEKSNDVYTQYMSIIELTMHKFSSECETKSIHITNYIRSRSISLSLRVWLPCFKSFIILIFSFKLFSVLWCRKKSLCQQCVRCVKRNEIARMIPNR